VKNSIILTFLEACSTDLLNIIEPKNPNTAKTLRDGAQLAFDAINTEQAEFGLGDSGGCFAPDRRSVLDSFISLFLMSVANTTEPEHNAKQFRQALATRLGLEPDCCLVGNDGLVWTDSSTNPKITDDRYFEQLESQADDALPYLKLATSEHSLIIVSREDKEHGTTRPSATTLRPREDPIRSLSDTLGLWRFLTLNYDMEIERYFEAINYPRGTLSNHPTHPRAAFQPHLNPKNKARYSRSFLGDSAESNVVVGNSISDLIELATMSREVGMRVVHLHGRADEPPSIIASESDYTQMYLNREAHRHAFQHGLSICFSGNPVLFIGTDIAEQDIQHTLRQFIAEKDDLPRELFVLLPAIDDARSREIRRKELFIRYGVQTLYYGECVQDYSVDGSISETESDSEESQAPLKSSYKGIPLAAFPHGLEQPYTEFKKIDEKLKNTADQIKKPPD
jgi:hypothetical protein